MKTRKSWGRTFIFVIYSLLFVLCSLTSCDSPTNGGGGGDKTAPVLSAGSVSRTSDTEATISFTTDEAGTAYYVELASGAAAPTSAAVKSDVNSLGAAAVGANSKDVTLTAGVRDIYVVVEDKSGNISEPLKIEAAAYVDDDDVDAPVLSAGGFIRTGETTAVISFTIDEAGTAYYLVLSSGAAVPAKEDVLEGTLIGAVAAGANTDIAVTVTAAASNIFVVVEDAAGNISAPLKIEATAYDPDDTTAPILSAGGSVRTGETTAVISFSSDEAGTAYYLVLASGATEPTSEDVKDGTLVGAVTVGANTGKAVTVTAAAGDIFVVVEDAAGNISVPLKIEAAAFDPSDITPPVLSGGSVSRTSDTAATIAFSTDEAGTAYYVQLANGAAAPTSTAVRAGTSLGVATVGANAGKAIALTAGARDIYVVVEDAAGNISIPLKIEAVAYIAPDTTAPVLSDGSVSRTSDTAATITFSTDEAGTAYYVQLANGASAPTGAAVRAGTSLGAAAVGANSKGVTLTAGARDIYVVVEDAAGNISAPLKIEAVAYIAPDTTAPVLSDGSVSRTSDTAATISFTTDEVGTAYYVELTSGATAPASATVRAGTSLGAATLGANSGKAVTLTAGARDIYVVVEDAAGNISAPLKIEAAAYDSSDPWAGFSAGLYLGAPESLNSSSTPEAVAANDLAAAVTYANANPAEYTLLLDSAVTITIGAQTLNSGNLTLIGLGSVRTISASATGYVLFTVNSGASLTLGSNITIQGLGTSHAYQLISITAGGKLVMKNGSTLTGNTSVVNGGAVRVDGVSAVFDMEGGIIHANYVTNASASGGGVCVNNGGTFNMRGTAEISDNHVTNPYGNGNGGGVFMYEGSFNMEGGTIRANSATGTTTATGGGVYYYGSATTTFSKIGGTIYGDGAGADSNVLIATTNKYGYAARVYFNSDPGGWRDRNTTADPGVILNDPSNSGWE